MAATRKLRWFWAALPALLLACCAREPVAQLFPLRGGPFAGVLTATLSGFGQGNGGMEIVTRNGEAFEGRYAIVLGRIPGFGSLLVAGRGPRGCYAAYGYTSDFAACGIGEGTASLVSDWGTAMRCEFLNDDPEGHGAGACLASTGVAYRILY